LHIAEGAGQRVAAVRKLVSSHDAEAVSGLSPDEVEQLRSLLSKVATAQGIGSEGHPGYGPASGRNPEPRSG
ncbi:MAG: hypothetical protein ABIR34_11025, partial [Marmoricola sp.]